MESLFDPALLITRYDKNYEHCADLYDNLPYERNFDDCNGPIAGAKSGNIIKYYLYEISSPVYQIALKNDLVNKRIAEYRLERETKQEPEITEAKPEEMAHGITSEQMESLLSDPDSEEEEDSALF